MQQAPSYGRSAIAVGVLFIACTAVSIVAIVPFLIGTLMYSYLMFKTRLVPRWLSGWGLVGALSYLGVTIYSGFAQQFGFTSAIVTFSIPIAVQEMVLAVWLIVKGFNPSPATSGSSARVKASAEAAIA